MANLNFKHGLDPKESLGVGIKNYDEHKKDCQEKFESRIMNRYKRNIQMSCASRFKIIDIDAEETIRSEHIEFIQLVFGNMNADNYLYLINMIPYHVPVFLVNKATFATISDDKNPISRDLLGWYQRLKAKNIQAIFICVDQIREVLKNNSTKKELNLDDDAAFKYLLAKVVIHEFAHALMDHPDFQVDRLTQDDYEKYRWIEESMANAITRRLSNNFSIEPEFDKFIEAFINECQPDEYKMGNDFFDKELHEDWAIWTDFKGDPRRSLPDVESKIEDYKKYLEQTLCRCRNSQAEKSKNESIYKS